MQRRPNLKNGMSSSLSNVTPMQMQTIDRRTRALERVDKRELRAFDRDNKRYARDRARGEVSMPSLTDIAKTEHQNRRAPPDLLHAFERAKKGRRTGPPDLTAVFEQAARENTKSRGGDHSGETSFEKARPPDFGPHQRNVRSRDEE